MNDDYITDYERGDRFLEDLSHLSEDGGMSEFIREHRNVYEIQRVVEDKNTGETLYYLQSVEGFETQLMTDDEIRDMEAYNYEGDSE